MTATDLVTLVAADGRPTGVGEKLAVHRDPGQLHLAFSVFLYRKDGATLLQQRSASKYHFPLAWANACCSHPVSDEGLEAFAARRVKEELRCEVELRRAGSFVYRARCASSDLVEYEFDEVLIGIIDAEPNPNPDEVAATRWLDPKEVFAGVLGERAAPWLLPGLRIAEQARNSNPSIAD